MYSCIFSFKLIGINSENPDGAKRTRTADPLHAMQVLYQLSYGPTTSFFLLYQSIWVRLTFPSVKVVICCSLLSYPILRNNLRKIDLQKVMANREDEWIQILRKNIRLFNGKGWSIRGIKSGKLKKLQITHSIDDGLQHENPRESILTSIEFVQQNSPDIQTLIKDLHDLINERKVSLVEDYKISEDNT